MRILAGTAAILLLAGCAPAPIAAEAPPVTLEPDVVCLPVSAGAVAGLQWGLDDRQDAFTVGNAAAIKNPSSNDSWFVAATFSGPGVDRALGVWSTLLDPALDEDHVYVSVDAVAAEFSGYAQPDGYSAALPGVDDVKSCLE